MMLSQLGLDASGAKNTVESIDSVDMNASTADPQDDNSDYGSDFTPEEEDILNGILLQPSRRPNHYPDLDLLPADIADDENTYATTLHYNPCSGSQERSWHFGQRPIEGKSRISIKIGSYGSSSTICKLRPVGVANLIDNEASSWKL